MHGKIKRKWWYIIFLWKRSTNICCHLRKQIYNQAYGTKIKMTNFFWCCYLDLWTLTFKINSGTITTYECSIFEDNPFFGFWVHTIYTKSNPDENFVKIVSNYKFLNFNKNGTYVEQATKKNFHINFMDFTLKYGQDVKEWKCSKCPKSSLFVLL